MAPCEQALEDNGKEKRIFNRKNNRQKQAQRGAAICFDMLRVMEGRQVKKKNTLWKRLIITINLMQSGV